MEPMILWDIILLAIAAMNIEGFVFYFATSSIFVMEKGQDEISRREGGQYQTYLHI